VLLVLARALTVLLAVFLAGCSSVDGDGAVGPVDGPTADTEREESEVPTSVRLSPVPAIRQPGPAPAPSPEPSGFVVSVDPALPGGDVVLEVRRTGSWEPVGHAQQDATGWAWFARPDLGRPQWYRATVVGPEGRPVSSRPARALPWRTVFRDEFDGTTLDEARWAPRAVGVYNPEGSRQCSKSDPSAVSVANGTLRLEARRDPERLGEKCITPADGTHPFYLNGHVGTEGILEFRRGVAAARVRFQRARGQHGAFWLQRGGHPVVPGDPGRSGAEIDVAEYFGEGYPGGGLASFVYYVDEQGETRKVGGIRPRASSDLPPGDDWWRRYHVFSVEWTEEGYLFRVDGREMFRTRRGVSNVDQFLVLSLLTSDWELAQLDPGSLPSTMNVDWVRVWSPP
jgi:beta-glucanase (GH16 family)